MTESFKCARSIRKFGTSSKAIRTKLGWVCSFVAWVAELIIDLEGEPVLFEAPLPQIQRRGGRGPLSKVKWSAQKEEASQNNWAMAKFGRPKESYLQTDRQTDIDLKWGSSFHTIELKRCEMWMRPPPCTHFPAVSCVNLKLRFEKPIADISRSPF